MDIYYNLQKYFGFKDFRPGQKNLIESVIKGRDALAIMPTGGGKSLCYQLPATLMEGVTLVISPLISLMKDQVDSLNELGISAGFINSSLTNLEYKETMKNIENNHYSLIYLAPERLNSYDFIQLANRIKISMIAVDEAHCISQWGHDFRPSYKQIPRFIASLKTRPVVSAYTATATKKVTQEIISSLGLTNPRKELVGFDRPNLFYSVVKTGNKLSYLENFIKKNHSDDSGIIYCSTRKTVESLYKALKDSDFSLSFYHGGMSNIDREAAQNDFIMGRKNIIIATNAFGMGIDKPDVSFVIHYNMPQNMESYYQEAGRAGRDGRDANCLLMYSPGDIIKQKLLIQSQTSNPQRELILYENLQYLVDYCHTNTCLRREILNYFDEIPKFDNCMACSNCLDDSSYIDLTVEAQKILSCIYRVGEAFGVNMVIDVLRGSKNKKVLTNKLDQVSTYGIMKDYRPELIRELIMTLIAKDYIYMTLDRFPVLKLTAKSREILNGEVKFTHRENLIDSINTKREKSSGDSKLLAKLKSLRKKISLEKNIPPFMIFSDESLEEIAVKKPVDKGSFLKIKGVGEKKYNSYAGDFINLIINYVDRSNSKESLEERYLITYNLYLEDLSLDELAKKRGFTPSTIVNHLAKLEEMGYEINWAKFLDKKKEEEILRTIEKFSLNSLKLIKDQLTADYSYEDINICIAKNKLKEE